MPYFAGEPLSYHWFADFHGAIAAVAADLPIIPVFFVSSALMAGVLALVVWGLAERLTGRRSVATIATLLVCFGGGMGWLRLIGDVLAGAPSIAALVVERPYDNSWADGWPFFRIASVFGTGFLPHRATTFGLPGTGGSHPPCRHVPGAGGPPVSWWPGFSPPFWHRSISTRSPRPT